MIMNVQNAMFEDSILTFICQRIAVSNQTLPFDLGRKQFR